AGNGAGGRFLSVTSFCSHGDGDLQLPCNSSGSFVSMGRFRSGWCNGRGSEKGSCRRDGQFSAFLLKREGRECGRKKREIGRGV
ncbi:hypothetical protein TorRG33x02_298500, partial [Trema orientale]